MSASNPTEHELTIPSPSMMPVRRASSSLCKRRCTHVACLVFVRAALDRLALGMSNQSRDAVEREQAALDDFVFSARETQYFRTMDGIVR